MVEARSSRASSSNGRTASTHSRPPPAASSSANRSSASTILAIAAASVRPRPSPSSASPYTSSSSYQPHSSPASNNTVEMSLFLETTFCPAVKPTPEECRVKEEARKELELLAKRIDSGATLQSFGSMANGFALRNSDMDLCCISDKTQGGATTKSPSELVELLGRLIETETEYSVKMLPRARIPIIKLSRPPSEALPFGISCDIGFENRLALENTKLLLTYANVDNRLKTMVLFLKVWTKRRQINNPYRGTLSSYGYVLLVIYFLEHVKQPPVLPNLQRLKSSRPVSLEELEFDGHDISFYNDVESLKSVWSTSNTENSAELLIEFFRFFAKEFAYSTHVVSIRHESGNLTRERKGWPNEPDYDPDYIIRDQYRLCIEDPFQLDYNVARTVTRDGLYTIRGEFIRAHRMLASCHPDRISTLINEVCEEREDFIAHHPPPYAPSLRRKSAPSPRMSSAILAQPPVPAAAMSEFRIWAALNGVDRAAGSSPNGAATTATYPTNGNGYTRGGKYHVEEAWDPSSLPSTVPASSSYSAHSTPSQYHRPSSHSASNQQHYQHHHHLQQQQPHQQLAPYPQTTNLVVASRSHPASTPCSPPSVSTSTLERRTSWDGSRTTTTTTPASIPASYDLHRFFQNQPGDSSASSTDQLTTPSASTAPPSPDANSAMFADYYGAGPGRTPYRYNYPSQQQFSNGAPPRTTSSLPRTYHASVYQSPAPIFPEADREAIVLANSITFGNFGPAAMPFPPFSAGSNSAASVTNHPSPSLSSSMKTFGGLIDEEEDEDEVDELRLSRGRRSDEMNSVSASSLTGLMANGLSAQPDDAIDFGQRRRGRSVPMRTGFLDGREVTMLKFGEVETEFFMPRVTIRPDEDEQVKDKAVNGRTTTTNESLGRQHGMVNGDQGVAGDNEVLLPIPTLVTSPPTPIKPRTSIPPLPSFVAVTAAAAIPIPLSPVTLTTSPIVPATLSNGWSTPVSPVISSSSIVPPLFAQTTTTTTSPSFSNVEPPRIDVRFRTIVDSPSAISPLPILTAAITTPSLPTPTSPLLPSPTPASSTPKTIPTTSPATKPLSWASALRSVSPVVVSEKKTAAAAVVIVASPVLNGDAAVNGHNAHVAGSGGGGAGGGGKAKKHKKNKQHAVSATAASAAVVSSESS